MATHEAAPADAGDGGAGDAAHASEHEAQDFAEAAAQVEEGYRALGEEPVDYAVPEHWLCRPGHNAACEIDLDATVVHADGSTELEPFIAAKEPEIDCFYAYPTVSRDPMPHSDLIPGADEELAVVGSQFARFGSQCRLFAPVYRSITLGVENGDYTLSALDVASALLHYLEHDNQGRGFVLYGHSQGGGLLKAILQQIFDASPVDKRLLLAVLAGTNLLVPKGDVVGADLKHIPLCETPEQLGCALAFASFRAGVEPPDDARFISSDKPGLVAGCTNPARLDSGRTELDAYLYTHGPGGSSVPMGEWAEGLTVDTGFVKAPGFLSAECKFAKTGSYLAIELNADPNDPRTDDIVGDTYRDGRLDASWGLHRIDPALVMGNLLELTRAKAAAYRSQK